MSKYQRKDLTGQKFNQLTAIRPLYKHPVFTRWVWLWRCDCGTEIECSGSSVSRGNRQSCGCLQKQRAAEANNKRKLPNLQACKNSLYSYYKNSAKARCLDFSISKEIFLLLVSCPCHYCNRSPSNCYKVPWSDTDKLFYNGLDRVDNDLGYVIDNVKTCCAFCNLAKKDLSYLDFLHWVKSVYEHLGLASL